MKKMYKLKQNLKLLLLVIFVGVMGSASAQMSGTYTIDNTVVTGGTNFASWLDFRNNIVSVGVNGAVTVNVMTDITETSQIILPVISGTSSTNTVKINGNNKFISFGIADAVILLQGADYFTFDKLVVRNTTTSQYAQGYRFMYGSDNVGADNNTISNGTIEFSAMATATTSGGAYISFSASATSPTGTNTLSYGVNNTISGNLMRTTNTNSPGPSYGVTMKGSTSTYTTTAQNNTLTGNTIQNFYYMAIYMGYTNGNQVLNNDVSRTNATSYNCFSTIYGVYSIYSYAASRPTQIDGNNLHDWPFTGGIVSSAPTTIYGTYTQYNYGNATYRFSISNNKMLKLKANQYMYLGYNFYNYFFDLVGNMADDDDITVSSSSSYQFYGFWNSYTYNSYKFNSNTIQNCDGGYSWWGIRNDYAQAASGVQQINDNLIQNNTKSYYNTYRIQSTWAQNSNATYPIDILRNTIKNNTSDWYNCYGIYCYYYGTYNVTDNVIENNTSVYYTMHDISAQWYGNYNIQRNKITNNKNVSGNAGYHYGIYNYYNYNSNVTDNLIADNAGYYGTYGIYAFSFNSGTYTSNIRQNTVKIDGTKSPYTYHYSYGLYVYLYYFTAVNVQGNIVDIAGNYGAYPAYTFNVNATNIKWDRNSYYVNNISYQYWYSPGGGANNFAGWNSLSFAGPNEKYGDPKWQNAGTYDLRSITLMNQNNVPYNALNVRDANQVLRNTSKNDRGALESVLDIQTVSTNFAPNSFECAGYTASPSITIKNNFAEPIIGVAYGMSSNGVLLATATLTSTVAIGGTGTVTFPAVKFSKAGSQNVKMFELDADDIPSNDTVYSTFLVKTAPGGGALSLNTTLSAAKAHFDITGKPDITTNGQKIAYNLTPPATVGYTNADYGIGNKWFAMVSGKTKWGVSVPAGLLNVNPPSSGNVSIEFTPSLAFVDSTITLSIRVLDFISSCDTTYMRNVLVAPQGVPDMKLPTIICDKDEVFFENTSTVSSGALLSTWDFGDGSATVDATSPVYKYDGPGTYTITLTVVTAPYGYVTKTTRTVNVNEIPTANFKNVNACSGTAVKLTNTTTIGSGSLSYVWDFGDGSPTSTSTNTTKLYNAPGGYKVTLTASGNGCLNVVSKNVYQFARPVAAFTKTAGSCENDLFEFMNNSTLSQGEFGNSWDFNDGGNKATVSEPKYDFLTSGVKKVKLKVVSEFGCTDSMETNITVKPVSVSAYTFPFACSRTKTQFTNTTMVPAGETVNTTTWDFGDGFTSTSTSPLKQWFSIGPKIVKLSTTLTNGCKDETSQIVTVGVQPLVNFQFADQCANSEVQFTNLTSFTQGKVTYDWDFGDANTSNLGSPRHTYTTGLGTQSFTVKLKAGIAGGCSDSMIQVININPLPTTCNFDITRDYNTSAKAYKFTPTGGALTNISYTWLTGDGNTVPTNGTGTSYIYSNSGKYCVTMIARNSSGCECSSTKCVTLALDVNSASALNSLITIFPNPTSGVFNVKLDAYVSNGMVVNVYNAIGEIVKTVNVDTNNANLDLSAFANGVYVVKVVADNQVATKQIILNK